jgi:hypothetical protein
MNFQIWWLRKKPNFGLGKVGCCVNKNSLDAPFTFNSKISWFMADSKIIHAVHKRAHGRKVLLAYSGMKEKELIDLIVMYHMSIAGVVWDYDFGSDHDYAMVQLSNVYQICQQLKIKFGVGTRAHPQTSLKTNGVAFDKADFFCDFLMPKLYSQWWNHHLVQTYDIYIKELQASSVPLIPVIARATTNDKVKYPILTNQLLIDNYYPLNLKCLAVWNVSTADQGFWDEVEDI